MDLIVKKNIFARFLSSLIVNRSNRFHFRLSERRRVEGELKMAEAIAYWKDYSVGIFNPIFENPRL